MGSIIPSDQSLLQNQIVKATLPFINGGIAGAVATTVIQPVDMVKVRLQLAGEGARVVSTATAGVGGGGTATATVVRPSAIEITSDLLRNGKLRELYTGLSAGLLRQGIYTTARLGLFDTIISNMSKPSSSTSPSAAVTEGKKVIGFKERAGAGLAAGGIAALISNPADLALIRMQADGLRPVSQRQNYSSAIDALTRISRTEGVARLWAGCAPTVARAMALNFGQLAFFSESKARLAILAPNMSTRSRTLTASAAAGFFASFFSLPFDFVKTRLQKQTKGAGSSGGLKYSGTVDCFVKVAKEEGILRFYRGFGTYYLRIAPHAMVTLLVADYLGWLTK